MENKIMNASLRTAGHYIDIPGKTVYITKQFQKKAEQYGTVEYEKYCEIEQRFPTFTITVHSQKRKNSAISYEMMELFIRNMPDAEKNIVEFERIKQMSHAFKSAYKYVANWFEKQFPFYGSLVTKDKDGNVVWNAVEMYRKAQEQAEAKKNASNVTNLTVISNENTEEASISA